MCVMCMYMRGMCIYVCQCQCGYVLYILCMYLVYVCYVYKFKCVYKCVSRMSVSCVYVCVCDRVWEN